MGAAKNKKTKQYPHTTASLLSKRKMLQLFLQTTEALRQQSSDTFKLKHDETMTYRALKSRCAPYANARSLLFGLSSRKRKRAGDADDASVEETAAEKPVANNPFRHWLFTFPLASGQGDDDADETFDGDAFTLV